MTTGSFLWPACALSVSCLLSPVSSFMPSLPHRHPSFDFLRCVASSFESTKYLPVLCTTCSTTMERSLALSVCIVASVMCNASSFVQPAATRGSEKRAFPRDITKVQLSPVDALHFLPTTSSNIGQEAEIAVKATNVAIAQSTDIRETYNSPGGWIFLAYIGFSVLAGLSELSSRFQKWRENRED